MSSRFFPLPWRTFAAEEFSSNSHQLHQVSHAVPWCSVPARNACRCFRSESDLLPVHLLLTWPLWLAVLSEGALFEPLQTWPQIFVVVWHILTQCFVPFFFVQTSTRDSSGSPVQSAPLYLLPLYPLSSCKCTTAIYKPLTISCVIKKNSWFLITDRESDPLHYTCT